MPEEAQLWESFECRSSIKGNHPGVGLRIEAGLLVSRFNGPEAMSEVRILGKEGTTWIIVGKYFNSKFFCDLLRNRIGSKAGFTTEQSDLSVCDESRFGDLAYRRILAAASVAEICIGSMSLSNEKRILLTMAKIGQVGNITNRYRFDEVGDRATPNYIDRCPARGGNSAKAARIDFLLVGCPGQLKKAANKVFTG